MKHNKIEKLLICCCVDYQLVKQESIHQLYSAAVKAGIDVDLCADFCLETIETPDKLKNIGESNIAVAACQPRAVTSLFSRVGASVPTVIDIRNNPIDYILKKLDFEKNSIQVMDLPAYQNEWKAWYPVIDTTRCTRCGKCVDFCFFGVYQKKDDSITVASPQNCKNNCPACARMCPQQAIIFPKHMDELINGGLNATSRVEQKGDNFDGNLYQRLADRRRAQKKKTLLKE